MLNLRTLILGQPRTCPQTGLQNEPRYSEKLSEFGTVNWTPYKINEFKIPEAQKLKETVKLLFFIKRLLCIQCLMVLLAFLTITEKM